MKKVYPPKNCKKIKKASEGYIDFEFIRLFVYSA